MTRVVYCTASSLHGVLADEHDSFDWLIEAPQNDDGSWKAYIEGGGALVMGAPTYQWCSTGTSPTDPSGEVHGDHPCWVFTHRDLPGEPVRRAWLTDEIQAHLTPVLLGAGARLLPRRVTSSRLRFREGGLVGQQFSLTLEVTRGREGPPDRPA